MLIILLLSVKMVARLWKHATICGVSELFIGQIAVLGGNALSIVL